ncbi:MAG: DegV family protein [Actinobacteria bacterium]|nr:DegV family protein [Actinomycetota bacterium]
MPAVKIVTDSACDLKPEIAGAAGIDVVPLTIRFGAREFLDRVELTDDQFWDLCATSDALPETAAPSPGAFQEVFSRAASDNFSSVLCLTMSGALSATYQSATAASQSVSELIDVVVIDTKTVSMGVGLMALRAAELARAGGSLEDLTVLVENLISTTRVYGALDTLEYLKKGGRIGSAAAMLGSVLSLKPIVEVRNGAVEAESRQRTRSRSFRHLVELVGRQAPIEKMAIAHARATDLDQLLDLLAAVFPREQILVTSLGPVIGSHTGPGSVGLCFEVAKAELGQPLL